MGIVHFLNVNEGDCIWIEHPSEHNTIIDISNGQGVTNIFESASLSGNHLNVMGCIFHAVRWLTGQFFVQNDTCLSFMIIFMRKFMIIMCYRQTKLQSALQKRTVQKEARIICGFTVQGD